MVYIEISPSNKAKCKGCGKYIGKGTPRIAKTVYGTYGAGEIYYCHKCSEKYLKEEIDNLKYKLIDLKRQIKAKTKEILAMELANQNPK